jgi:hypothetical protein
VFFGINQPQGFCQLLSQLDQQERKTKPSAEKRVYTKRYLLPRRASLVGVLNHFGSGGGFEFTKLFVAKFHLAFNAIYTSANLSGETPYEATEVLNANTLRLSVTPRFFLWKRFYIGTGLHIANTEGDFGFEGEAVVNDNAVRPYQARILYGDVVVGNEWRFDDFFVGFDWVGFSYAQMIDLQMETDPLFDQDSTFLTGETAANRVTQEIGAQIRLTYVALRFGFQF